MRDRCCLRNVVRKAVLQYRQAVAYINRFIRYLYIRPVFCFCPDVVYTGNTRFIFHGNNCLFLSFVRPTRLGPIQPTTRRGKRSPSPGRLSRNGVFYASESRSPSGRCVRSQYKTASTTTPHKRDSFRKHTIHICIKRSLTIPPVVFRLNIS